MHPSFDWFCQHRRRRPYYDMGPYHHRPMDITKHTDIGLKVELKFASNILYLVLNEDILTEPTPQLPICLS